MEGNRGGGGGEGKVERKMRGHGKTSTNARAVPRKQIRKINIQRRKHFYIR